MIATRLYTEEYFLNHMSNEGIPEIQRSSMVSCVIQVSNCYGIISQKQKYFSLVYFLVLPPLSVISFSPSMELFDWDDIFLINRMTTNEKLHHCYFELS